MSIVHRRKIKNGKKKKKKEKKKEECKKVKA